MKTTKRIKITVSVTANEFFDFLKENNAYTQYVDNFLRMRPGDSPVEFFKKVNASDWIGAAFAWIHTPEKNSFWYKLNGKWTTELGIDHCVGKIKDSEQYDGIDIIYDVCLTLKDEETIRKTFTAPPPESIVGKMYVIKDTAYSQAVTPETRNCACLGLPVKSAADLEWEEKIRKSGKTFLILSEPEEKRVAYCGVYKFIQVWIPELNCGQYVLFYPSCVIK